MFNLQVILQKNPLKQLYPSVITYYYEYYKKLACSAAEGSAIPSDVAGTGMTLMMRPSRSRLLQAESDIFRRNS